MTHVFKTTLLLALLVSMPAMAQSPAYEEGTHYVRLEPAQPTSHPKQVEVLEVFSYSCHACYAFDPILHDWLQDKPDAVAFARMPAVFGPAWEVTARAYYTLKALGKQDALHSVFFEALFEENKQFQNQQDLAAFFATHGVDPEAYLAASESFGVEARMRRSKSVVPAYGVTGTPTIIVDGKYRVTPGEPFKSYEELLAVVDYLVQKEISAQSVSNTPVTE